MKRILGALLLVVAGLFAGCEREFDEPILQEPVYTGPEANMTIAEFREKFANVSTTPELITVDYIMKGVVTANDVTGNVYKALYIEDETGGMCISIDQTNMYASHRVGQEIYIDLHGLYALKYSNALQIGYLNSAASNRVPWEIFIEHESFNGYPDASRVAPKTLDLAKLIKNEYKADEVLHTLIRLDDVYFENGGKNPYSSTTTSTSEKLWNAAGTHSIDVRTSNYATFVGETLPVGKGTIIGVLGLYNTNWQLTLRSLDDVLNFPDDVPDGPDPEDPDPEDGVIFSETFGNGKHETTETRPRVADFDGWDEKDVTYTDQAGQVSIRSTSRLSAHAWFPASSNAYLTIAGINTAQYEDLKLTFSLAAQVDAANTNTYNFTDLMTVKWNDTPLTFTGSTMTVNSDGNNTFFSFEVTTPITATTGNTLEFFASATGNTIGVRLDDIKITGTGEGDGNGHGDGGGVIPPDPGDETRFFYETFGTGTHGSGNRPYVEVFTGFDETGVTYSATPVETLDIRSLTTGNNGAHVWFPANKAGKLTVSGINTSAYSDIKLSFEIAANVYNATDATNLNVMSVTFNGTSYNVPSTPVSGANSDDGKFYEFNLDGLPAVANGVLEFSVDGTANTHGLRLDNIAFIGEE